MINIHILLHISIVLYWLVTVRGAMSRMPSIMSSLDVGKTHASIVVSWRSWLAGRVVWIVIFAPFVPARSAAIGLMECVRTITVDISTGGRECARQCLAHSSPSERSQRSSTVGHRERSAYMCVSTICGYARYQNEPD